MAKYCYIEEDEFEYYKIKCEICDKEADITETQMQRCIDADIGEVCYECMWKGREE